MTVLNYDAGAGAVDARFQQDHYIIRQKVFKVFGNAFHIYDAAGNVVLYSKLKAFKLKEDIRLYTGQDMRVEVLTIQARSVIDFGASYDVFDPIARQRVGSLRRRGFKSMIRDEWLVFDAAERQVATVREDSQMLALVRRFIEIATLFLPQKYHAEANGQVVAMYHQNFNPFVRKLAVDVTDPNSLLDRRLVLVTGILLAAIEGRQE
jgi:hypothetical protein